MKESILGLTTMAILFGLVWLSQGEIYTSKDSFKEDIIASIAHVCHLPFRVWTKSIIDLVSVLNCPSFCRTKRIY